MSLSPPAKCTREHLNNCSQYSEKWIHRLIKSATSGQESQAPSIILASVKKLHPIICQEHRAPGRHFQIIISPTC